MSGGVDSSVSAYLLKQQGFDLIGLFMKNWEEDDTDEYCSAAQDREDAEAICHKLDIPFHSINFSSETSLVQRQHCTSLKTSCDLPI